MNKKTLIIISVIVFLLVFVFNSNANTLIQNPMLSDLNTRGSKNKNPLNIKKGGKTDWQGTISYDSYGHAVFSSVELGVRAALKDIQGKINRGINTIPSLLSKWAEANVGNYTAFVTSKSGLTTTEKLVAGNKEQLRKLVYYMGIWESKYYISKEQFDTAWEML